MDSISNTGTADLVVSSITVGGGSGFALSTLPSLPATVAPSGSIPFDVSFSPLAGGAASDTVTVVSNAATSPTLIGVAGLGVVVAPSVQLIKTAGSAADGAVLSVTAGSSVTYSYQVTNSGDTELINVAVTDSVLGSVGTIAVLASGAAQTLTATATINADVTNLGTVTGTPSSGGVSLGLPIVSDTDDAVVDVVGPSLQLIKTAGAAAAGLPPPGAGGAPAAAGGGVGGLWRHLIRTAGAPAAGVVLPVVSGTSVTYSYQVTNTG